MRNYIYKGLSNYIQLFNKIHQVIKIFVSGSADVNQALSYLESCQQKAIEMGTCIETSEGEGHATVKLLEDYCEKLYEIHELIASGDYIHFEERINQLDNILQSISDSVKKDITVKKLALFLPYKACMWDSLEGFWEEVSSKEDWEAVVIPIPYYDKNPDGSFRKQNYEGDMYPENVPIVSYSEFDFACRADEIYIHNPYDNCNFVTSVPEFFFSSNLVKMTDRLIYVPYYVLDDPDPQNESSLEAIEHFIMLPGVINSHQTIVQSQKMKEAYVKILTKKFGQNTKEIWEEKIVGTGSSKLNKARQVKRDDQNIPNDWLRKIQKPDGSFKKIVLYNNSVTALIRDEEKVLEKIKSVFEIFRRNSDRVALLWRPHPLIEATLLSMEPALYEKYQQIVEDYKTADWGIYDDSADLDRAIALADAYYGDPSSLVQLCETRHMPIMIQNVELVTY